MVLLFVVFLFFLFAFSDERAVSFFLLVLSLVASLMQFERIKELVTSKDVQEILTALEKIAVLVQGCWVVKRFETTFFFGSL